MAGETSIQGREAGTEGEGEGTDAEEAAAGSAGAAGIDENGVCQLIRDTHEVGSHARDHRLSARVVNNSDPANIE